MVNIIKFANILSFADDCKLSMPINSLEDCYKLQSDVDKISLWCLENEMILSINKCNVISFTRSSHPIIFPYNIRNHVLSRVDYVKDLGVTFDSKVTFKLHLLNIVNNANKKWFFITRHTKSFKNPNSLRILFISLVRSILLYASSIWRPIFDCHMKRLEHIQHKVLRRLSILYGSPMHRFNHDYTQSSLTYSMLSIKSLFD